VRHEKLLKLSARPLTPRRLRAAERALQRERGDRPLLARQIAEEQPTPEERIRAIDAQQEAWWQTIRDHAAQTWRKARRLLFSLPEEERQSLLAQWQSGPLPGRSEYLADFVRCKAARGGSGDGKAG
jgi:hypothetical protein